ncbi:hypothetical protein, unknown function [Leishmania tarentolae]|uniref:Uncharacterized protein n=1 Tax=Leishmania tarentolae TaxID=5689 RepID=A0A640KRC9_LEITA|nr:hypothetical protein, unknown function [Leishmania tarentolae]
MSRPPGSAEELYELVCTLQKEQQLTQVDLRAVQRRIEALRQELHSQEEIIAEEEAKREELAAKRTHDHAERQLAEAHARGAARASADAAQELRSERQAFVQKCHDHVVSVGKGLADRRLSDFPAAPNKCTLLLAAADDSCSGSSSTVEVATSRGATLMPPAAVHQLLLLLRRKLTRCIEIGTTAGPAPLTATPFVTPTKKDNSSEQPFDDRPFTEQCAIAQVETTVMSPLVEKKPKQPSSISVTGVCVRGAAEGQISPRERKHIGFAPESSFERVTAVPAANVNRGTRKMWLTAGSPCACDSTAAAPPPAHVTAGGDNRPSNVARGTGSRPLPQRGGGHFTVRVASRSAALVAEAAALGAKRRRASEAANATQSSPPKAARADGGKGASTCTATQDTSVAAAFSTVYTNNDGRLLVPIDLLSPCSAQAGRNSSSGPGRRTVWTWTRGTSHEQEDVRGEGERK